MPRLIPYASTGLNQAVPSEAGFVVAEGFADGVASIIEDTSQIIPRCQRLPVSVSKVHVPAVDETARTTGSRHGGVVVVRTNEGGTVTPSRPKFSSIEMNPHRHTCIVYSSAELLQDVPALVSTLQTVIATEAAFTVEQDIVAGQGTGGCLGVLSAACTIEVEPESGQAPATVRPENLTKMIGRLWPACHSRAVWLMSIDAFAQIADASFSNGQAVVQYQGNRRFILGCELLITEYTNALGERGDVVLADFGEYIIADRGQSFLESMHVQYLYDEFGLSFRLEG